RMGKPCHAALDTVGSDVRARRIHPAGVADAAIDGRRRARSHGSDRPRTSSIRKRAAAQATGHDQGRTFRPLPERVRKRFARGIRMVQIASLIHTRTTAFSITPGLWFRFEKREGWLSASERLIRTLSALSGSTFRELLHKRAQLVRQRKRIVDNHLVQVFDNAVLIRACGVTKLLACL